MGANANFAMGFDLTKNLISFFNTMPVFCFSEQSYFCLLSMTVSFTYIRISLDCIFSSYEKQPNGTPDIYQCQTFYFFM